MSWKDFWQFLIVIVVAFGFWLGGQIWLHSLID